MKKMIFFWLIGLTFIIAGCDQFEEPVIIPDPVLIVSASPEVIPYGGSTTVTWNSQNSDYCLINGEKMSSSGSLVFEGIISTTNFEIVAVATEKIVKKILTVIVEEVSIPTLEILAPSEIIPFGDYTSFSWVAKGLITSVTLDDNVVVDSGLFQTPILYENEEYTLTVTGPGGIVTEKVMISVGDWTTSNLGLLTYDGLPWMLKSIKVLQNGEVVAELVLDEEQKTNLYYYRLKGMFLGVSYDYSISGVGVYEAYHSNGQIFGNGTWSFSESETHINDYLIVSLAKNKFIKDVASTWYGNPSFYREEYYRP